MSSSRDFVAATFADALLPILRRPVEDVIYETIDTRQIPTRTDFTEIRDLVNNLRGQLTGATGGVKKLAETVDELDERLEALETQARGAAALAARLDALAARLDALEARPAAASSALLLSDAPAPAAKARARKTAPAKAAASKPTPAAEADAQTDPEACRVTGCSGKVRAKNFCGKHYQQWRRGTLDGFPAPTA